MFGWGVGVCLFFFFDFFIPLIIYTFIININYFIVIVFNLLSFLTYVQLIFYDYVSVHVEE